MATQPIVLIAGYYGFGNWGDEATLAVLIHHLRAVLPQARLTVLTNDLSQTAQLHYTEAVNRWNLLEVRRVLQEASAFILGPGSLLQDMTSTRSLLYYLGLLRWAQRHNIPVYLLGQGIGPLCSRRSERWVAQTVQQARLVLVRDQASYQWALARGIHTLLGEDLAILAGPHPRRLSCSDLQKRDATRPAEGQRAKLGLSLRPGLSPPTIEVLRRALRTLSEKDFDFVFFPFQADQDLPVLRELSLPLSVVEAHQPDDLLHAMQSVDVVVGMRLHSLVFALLCAVPFCALSYDPKIESFVRRLEEVCEYPVQWWRAAQALDERALVQQILALHAQRAELQEHLRHAQVILRTAAQQPLNEAIHRIVADLGGRWRERISR